MIRLLLADDEDLRSALAALLALEDDSTDSAKGTAR